MIQFVWASQFIIAQRFKLLFVSFSETQTWSSLNKMSEFRVLVHAFLFSMAYLLMPRLGEFSAFVFQRYDEPMPFYGFISHERSLVCFLDLCRLNIYILFDDSNSL
jgi:hypothetical protein